MPPKQEAVTSYAFRLDYPPSVNTYWRRAGNRIYLSPAGRKYKKDVALSCDVQCHAAPLLGRLGVHIELASPNKTRDTDLDNRLKAILDALEGVAYENDRQIDHLIIKRLPIDAGGDGYADVIVSKLPATSH